MHSEKRKNTDQINHQNLNNISEDFVDNNGNILMYKRRKFGVNTVRGKIKKEQTPVPMKLRALPRSFWQQPNHPARQSPGEICPDLPVVKEEIVSPNTERLVTSRQLEAPKSPRVPPEEITTPANTELLFSLFRVVDNRQKSFTRRGRPKKTMTSQVGLKDSDPCLVSTVNEPPLVGAKKGTVNGQNGGYSNLLAELVVRL